MGEFDISKYRRFAEGLLWETEFPPDAEPRWIKVVDAAALLAVILVFVALIGWMQARDAKDQQLIQQELIAQKEAQSNRYAQMLADCLNGKAILDKLSNTALFCSEAVTIKNP